MGQNASSAVEKASEEEMIQIQGMINLLNSKVKVYEEEIKATKGTAAAKYMTGEVGGGREFNTMSSTFVSSGTSIDKDITSALGSFFNAARKEVKDDTRGAQDAAVAGTAKLLTAGLDSLFGVTHGQSAEISSFAVSYVGSAFRRYDFKCFTYSVSAKHWGVEANKCGSCYVAVSSILPIDELHPSEIDFLLSQAFDISANEVDQLQLLKLKVLLQISYQKLLRNATDPFDVEVLRGREKKIKQEINDVFKGLSPVQV